MRMRYVTTSRYFPFSLGSLPAWRASSMFGWLALLAVAFVVLFPIVQLLIYSFEVGLLGRETTWGLENWRSALSEPRMRDAIVNTLTLTVTQQGISFLIAVPLAWILARTDVPGAAWLEFGFWLAFFMPTLTVVLGWIVLFDAENGLINEWLDAVPFVPLPTVDIFSWSGIVLTHVLTGSVAIKVMLLTTAFRNMDSTFEEAARVCGAGLMTTMRSVVLPLMMPILTVVAALAVIYSFQSFEIELILGGPDRINIFSTFIYQEMLQEPPDYGRASALSMTVLAAVSPLVVTQLWVTRRHGHATVGGKYASRPFRLGRWRWPIFGILLLTLLVMTVLPLVVVVLGTFMKLFGVFNVPDPWTTNNWRAVFDNPKFVSSVKDTLVIAGSASLIGVLAYSVLAYLQARTSFFGRAMLDFISWLPAAIPGIVIGLGFLSLFLRVDFMRPLYGTTSSLVLVGIVASMPVGVQVLKGSMVLLGRELEEASLASGAAWLRTFRSIVLPTIAPTLAVVAVLTFATVVRSTGVFALISTGSARPLSIFQLATATSGGFGQAAVVGVVMLGMTIGVALMARLFGLAMQTPGGH